jgi:CRISPR-associated protein Csx10
MEVVMKKIKMTIELLSDTLSGSGEGFGAIIDTDVQYDEFGIPFISSKRVKGLLRNSLVDLFDMPAIKNIIGATKRNEILSKLFGKAGSVLPSSVEISDFFIDDYDQVKSWFSYLKTSYQNIFSAEKILAAFTNIRTQTMLDENEIAADHSLRTSRVVNRGLNFEAEVIFEEEDEESEKYLALACANLRRIGMKRNRGLGDVKCDLIGDLVPISIDNLKLSLEGK